MKFVNWDWRPAVLFPESAFAVLKKDGPWVEVDFVDVVSSAGLMSEADWRWTFEVSFGPLDLAKIPAQAASSDTAA